MNDLLSKIKTHSRLLAAILLAALVFSVLSGCTNSNQSSTGSGSASQTGTAANGTSGGNSAKGRYIEEDLTLPLQDGGQALNLTRTKEGDPVLFVSFNDTQVKRYEYNGQQWDETILDWFGQIYPGKEVLPMEVQETPDGIQYVRGMDENSQTYIAKSGDNTSGENLPIPYLSQQSELGYPVISGLLVDGSGNYWLQNPYEQKSVVIAGDTMETLDEFNTVMSFSMMQRLMYQGNETVALNTEENEFTVYDENREEQGTFSVKMKGGTWMCSDEEHWYLISEDGITRLTLGNDTQELIMDGSMGAMGSTVNSVAGAVRGKEDDFYILYYQDKVSTYSLKHYVYDPEAAAVPEHTLRVFGLSDSDTVREAAIGFQKTNPDVKVEFTTSDKQSGEITSDDIRTLNTELLSGNGADVLLLDGLPMNAYVEKGILAELTKTTEDLMKADTYLEPLMKNTLQKDGKIYGLPIKFSVPLLFGNEDAKKALQSLESLKAFLEKDPQASVFGLADKAYIRDFLFQMYQEEIFGEDGKVDQEKLTDLLELAEKIVVNAKSSIFEEGEDSVNGTVYERNPFRGLGSEGLINHPEGAATTSISSISDMMIPYTVMREKSLTPDTVQGFYIPEGVAGVNQNTDQMELALEFVKYLFSQEVQSAQLDDGFPVLESALQDKKNELGTEYADSYYMMSSWNFEDEQIELESGFPTLEEVEELIRLCGTLTTPAEQERIIWNIYQEEADQCLGGAVDAQTAAKNIAQKVDTYLAE